MSDHVRSWTNKAEGDMDWSWLLGAFGHPRIRPSDVDGQVHRHGRLFQLEGKVWSPPFGPVATPHTIMVEKTCNVTLLYLVQNPDTWHPDVTRRPTDLTHYRLMPGLWPAEGWVRGQWAELPPGDHATDEICRMAADWEQWCAETRLAWWSATHGFIAEMRGGES